MGLGSRLLGWFQLQVRGRLLAFTMFGLFVGWGEYSQAFFLCLVGDLR